MRLNPFEQYVDDVLGRADLTGKDEFTRELLGDLYAELDNVKRLPGETRDDMSLMQAVLASRQDARSLASSLSAPPKGLIGPEAYPIYRIAMVCTLATILAAVFACSIAVNPHDLDMWRLAGDLGLSVAAGFACLTICFAGMDRLGLIDTRGAREMQLSAWPRCSCRPYPRGHALFALALATVLTLAPGWIALPVITRQPSLGVVAIPVLDPGFVSRNLAMVDLWCAGVLVAWALYANGQSRHSRWVHLAVRAAGIAVAIRAFGFDSAFQLSAAGMARLDPRTAEALGVVAPDLLSGLMFAAWFGIAIAAVHLVRDSWGIVKSNATGSFRDA